MTLASVFHFSSCSGLFKDTLPTVPIEKLAILRLDGDMYSSTMDSLVNLYPKLYRDGYIIVDDYGSTEPCHKATDDFRASQKIDTLLNIIDAHGVYWKKMS
jgi:O-methyltransferase